MPGDLLGVILGNSQAVYLYINEQSLYKPCDAIIALPLVIVFPDTENP